MTQENNKVEMENLCNWSGKLEGKSASKGRLFFFFLENFHLIYEYHFTFLPVTCKPKILGEWKAPQIHHEQHRYIMPTLFHQN